MPRKIDGFWPLIRPRLVSRTVSPGTAVFAGRVQSWKGSTGTPKKYSTIFRIQFRTFANLTCFFAGMLPNPSERLRGEIASKEPHERQNRDVGPAKRKLSIA